jgi:hypothetical protein
VLFLRPDGTVKGHHAIRSGEGGLALGAGHDFGSSVAFVGDLDCNGTDDLAVGAPGELNRFGVQAGDAWILLLEPDGSVGRSVKLAGLAGGNQSVGSLAGAGDLDGDGVFDLVAGVPLDDDGATPGIGAGLGENHGASWVVSLDGIAVADFEGGDDQARTPLVNGQSLSSPPEFGRTLLLASAGPNLGPAIFDSTPLGPNQWAQDRDLLVGQGNVLVLQNLDAPLQTVPGIFDRPNDDHRGGTLAFSFAHGPVEPAHVDLVDIDLGAGQSASVTLFDAANRRRTYWVPAGWTEDVQVHGPPGVRTLDLTTLAPQPGFASTATATEIPGFDPRAVVRVEVHLGSSGAIDQLCWDPYPDP